MEKNLSWFEIYKLQVKSDIFRACLNWDLYAFLEIRAQNEEPVIFWSKIWEYSTGPAVKKLPAKWKE